MFHNFLLNCCIHKVTNKHYIGGGGYFKLPNARDTRPASALAARLLIFLMPIITATQHAGRARQQQCNTRQHAVVMKKEVQTATKVFRLMQKTCGV